MRNSILEAIQSALEEISPMIEKEFEFRENLKLTGSSGILDSVALVSLIASLEELISDTFDKEVLLVTDKAFAKGNNPFYSVDSLCKFVEELLSNS